MTQYAIIVKRVLKQRPTFYVSVADMLRLDMIYGENSIYTMQIWSLCGILWDSFEDHKDSHYL